jgi:hypothetical protein
MSASELIEWAAFEEVNGPFLDRRIDYLIALTAGGLYGKDQKKVLPPWLKHQGDGIEAAFAALAEMAKAGR